MDAITEKLDELFNPKANGDANDRQLEGGLKIGLDTPCTILSVGRTPNVTLTAEVMSPKRDHKDNTPKRPQFQIKLTYNDGPIQGVSLKVKGMDTPLVTDNHGIAYIDNITPGHNITLQFDPNNQRAAPKAFPLHPPGSETSRSFESRVGSPPDIKGHRF